MTDPAPARPLGLFEGFGVEIEWMIVDARSLELRPVADAILGDDGEVDRGPMAWSNELVLHVVEVKTNGPAASLAGLAHAFHAEVREVERRLEPLGCRLLSGPVHPWMDPDRETRIWPHEYTEVYRAFDRIFGVRGHGWANLQSTHLNLPFQGDAEFAALHQAIRLVLPLIPGLSAASPILEGVVQPNLDERMERYRTNALRVPAVSGGVIPDVVRSRWAYEEELLAGIYRELEPLDPGGTLRHEWVNARGAIARFQRGAIEIRIIDAQESPCMDLAVLSLVVAAVRRLTEAGMAFVDARGASPLERPDTGTLRELLSATVRDAERARVGAGRGDGARGAERHVREAVAPILELLGVADRNPREVGEIWQAVAEDAGLRDTPGVVDLLDRGPLARRLLGALASPSGVPLPGERISPVRLRESWEGVAEALRLNRSYLP